MQDDLQKAYSAYQQALYLLPDPKVPCLFRTPSSAHMPHRMIRSSGMVLEFSTTDMVLSIMPRRPSPLSFAWTKVNLPLLLLRRVLLTMIKTLTRPMKSFSALALSISSNLNMQSLWPVLTASFATLLVPSPTLIFGSKSGTSMNSKRM